jgi:hypothetical protein
MDVLKVVLAVIALLFQTAAVIGVILGCYFRLRERLVVIETQMKDVVSGRVRWRVMDMSPRKGRR